MGFKHTKVIPKDRETVDSFESDWAHTWSAEQSEKELTNFKFKGPGFYRHKGDVMLVVPCDRIIERLWHQEFKPEETFRFYVWNQRDPAPLFNAITNAPERGE